MQMVQDTVYKDKWAGVSSKDASADFAAGAVSATLSSTGSLVGVLKTAKFDVGVGFLPGGSADTANVCPTGGAGLGIPKNNTKEQQLAAATFLKFITSPENTADFSAATGYMPVRESADMTTVLAKIPQIKTAIDQLKSTRQQDYARAFLPGADQEMAKAASKILTQQGDVKTALSELQKTLEGIYSNDVKPRIPA
jgi:sn-glycerol 3-phosphate transport system substrate-binding protein